MFLVLQDETLKTKGKNIYLYTMHNRSNRQQDIIQQLPNCSITIPHSYSSIGIIKHTNQNIIIKPKNYLDVTFTYNYESMLMKMIIAQRDNIDLPYFLNNMSKYHHEDCHNYHTNYEMIPRDWVKILWDISKQCPQHLSMIGMVHKNKDINAIKQHYYKLTKQIQLSQRFDKFCPADLFLYDEIDTILQTKTFLEFKNTILCKIANNTFYPLSIKKTINPTLTLLTPYITLNINDKTVLLNDKQLLIQHRTRMGYDYMELCDKHARYGKGKIVSNDTNKQVMYCLCLHELALQCYYVF